MDTPVSMDKPLSAKQDLQDVVKIKLYDGEQKEGKLHKENKTPLNLIHKTPLLSKQPLCKSNDGSKANNSKTNKGRGMGHV